MIWACPRGFAPGYCQWKWRTILKILNETLDLWLSYLSPMPILQKWVKSDHRTLFSAWYIDERSWHYDISIKPSTSTSPTWLSPFATEPSPNTSGRHGLTLEPLNAAATQWSHQTRSSPCNGRSMGCGFFQGRMATNHTNNWILEASYWILLSNTWNSCSFFSVWGQSGHLGFIAAIMVSLRCCKLRGLCCPIRSAPDLAGRRSVPRNYHRYPQVTKWTTGFPSFTPSTIEVILSNLARAQTASLLSGR